MGVSGRWRRLLLTASAAAVAGVTLTLGAANPPPSEREVERRLRAVAGRGGFPLHEARCLRDSELRRTFVCLVEGPDDTHLAWEVRWLPDGELAVRRPDGSRISF